MKIESRVEALEHELKILKNEIQNTLLEIREQVLNHYYPELRAEEAPQLSSRPSPKTAGAPRMNEVRGNEMRSTKNAPAKGSERSIFAPQPQVQPFSDFFLEEDEEMEDAGIEDKLEAQDFDAHEYEYDEDESHLPELSARANAAPKLREVQYQQLKQAGATPHPKSKKGQPQASRPVRRPFAALAAWVGDSVAKVGKERTVQVIETYAASGGTLADDTKSSLMQLIALASDVEITVPVTNQEMLGLMVELDHLLAE